MHQRLDLLVFAACATLGLSGTTTNAQTYLAKKQPQAVEKFSDERVEFSLEDAPRDIHNITVTIIGPNGYHANVFSKRNLPALKLPNYGKMLDGSYQYEITAASGETVEIQSQLDNGRGKNERNVLQRTIVVTGSFEVADGVIKPKEAFEREPVNRTKFNAESKSE